MLISWPDDSKHYSGTVRHLHRVGCVCTNYDDGEREWLNLSDENCHYEDDINSMSASAS